MIMLDNFKVSRLSHITLIECHHLVLKPIMLSKDYLHWHYETTLGCPCCNSTVKKIFYVTYGLTQKLAHRLLM